jgi:hypothetical protein
MQNYLIIVLYSDVLNNFWTLLSNIYVCFILSCNESFSLDCTASNLFKFVLSLESCSLHLLLITSAHSNNGLMNEKILTCVSLLRVYLNILRTLMRLQAFEIS